MSATRRREQSAPVAARAAAAAEIVRPLTCLGCRWHVEAVRPRCTAETSPHFRTPRETYHARCDAFVLRGAREKGKEAGRP
jgi:hypothetical protein